MLILPTHKNNNIHDKAEQWGKALSYPFSARLIIRSNLQVFCNHLDGKERAGCFTLIVFLMSCDCKCSVALPRGAVGWSAVLLDHT